MGFAVSDAAVMTGCLGVAFWGHGFAVDTGRASERVWLGFGGWGEGRQAQLVNFSSSRAHRFVLCSWLIGSM